MEGEAVNEKVVEENVVCGKCDRQRNHSKAQAINHSNVHWSNIDLFWGTTRFLGLCSQRGTGNVFSWRGDGGVAGTWKLLSTLLEIEPYRHASLQKKMKICKTEFSLSRKMAYFDHLENNKNAYLHIVRVTWLIHFPLLYLLHCHKASTKDLQYLR